MTGRMIRTHPSAAHSLLERTIEDRAERVKRGLYHDTYIYTQPQHKKPQTKATRDALEQSRQKRRRCQQLASPFARRRLCSRRRHTQVSHNTPAAVAKGRTSRADNAPCPHRAGTHVCIERAAREYAFLRVEHSHPAPCESPCEGTIHAKCTASASLVWQPHCCAPASTDCCMSSILSRR